ncbi:MAG: tRNA 2-thiouridine(34) synthase MnmA [bacterium]|nr:tRNA 2-thiouridine(34) synthase MnmA [bacterium]
MARIWNKQKQTNTPLRRTVFVGLSGGVDSSVSAYLLKKQGFTVVGVFIKTWQPDWLECTWQNEKRSAMRVAAQLEIPFLICDATDEYKKEVADYLIAEYKIGNTPNPDAMCNKSVKFGAFYSFAKKHGADYVATGHYARVADGVLHTAVDAEKDQTYFLWMLSSDILKNSFFPIGAYTKKEVREIATKANLHTATKKDSQGLCFLGEVHMKEFLSHYIELHTGEVLSETGERIGTHDGSLLYTIGQRHGFYLHTKNIDERPLYVISKDLDANTITVSSQVPLKNGRLINLKDINWTDTPIIGSAYCCRTRYRQALLDCTVTSEHSVVINQLSEPPTHGQSLVLYDNNRCLGGGIIS